MSHVKGASSLSLSRVPYLISGPNLGYSICGISFWKRNRRPVPMEIGRVTSLD